MIWLPACVSAVVDKYSSKKQSLVKVKPYKPYKNGYMDFLNALNRLNLK